MQDITCCFTGSRPQKLIWGEDENDLRCLNVKSRLKKEIVLAIGKGYIHFITGMAQGIDLICAEIVLDLKKEYPDLKLEAAIPFKDQAMSWASKYKKRYENILKLTDEITVLSKGYTAYCMQRRNQYMVDKSSLLIAFDSKHLGGTKNTITYATKKNINIQVVEY